MNGTHSDGCIEVPSGVTTVATPQKPRSALDRQPPKPIPELPNLLEWSHRMTQTSVKKSHPVEGGLRRLHSHQSYCAHSKTSIKSNIFINFINCQHFLLIYFN